MSNSFLTIKDITREAVAVLHEESALAKLVTRKYEARFGHKDAQIGTSLQIRKPPRFTTVKSNQNSGSADMTGKLQDMVEDFATIDISKTALYGGLSTVPMQFYSDDLAAKIGDFSEQFIRPAVKRISRDIDIAGFQMMAASRHLRVPRQTSATDPTSAFQFIDSTIHRARLRSQLAPSGNQHIFMSPTDMANVVNANKGLFNSTTEIAKQYEDGIMGRTAGLTWHETMNLPTLTLPTSALAVSLGTLSATIAEGATTVAVTGGTANGVVPAGTAFTIPNINAIDPETQTQQGYLFTFITTSSVTLSAGGAGTLTFVPASWPSDEFPGIHYVPYNSATYGNSPTYQNAIYLAATSGVPTPPSGTAVTILDWASDCQGKTGNLILSMHKDALALAFLGLPVPGGVDWAASEEFEGYSMRITRQMYNVTDLWVTRLDCQFGWAVTRPELIVSSIGLVQ